MSPLGLAALAALLGLVLPAVAVEAQGGGFGVTPVEMRLVDPPLLRGQEYQGTFRLQNRLSEPLQVTATPQGALAPWLTLEPAGAFAVPAGATKELAVKVQVPADAANGDYAGAVRIVAAGDGDGPSGSGASVSMELVPAILARVGGTETVRFALEDARVGPAEAGKPLAVVAGVVNSGNVRSAPSFVLEVRDAEGAEALSETLRGQPMAPGTAMAQALRTTKALPEGAYEATLSLVGSGQAVRGLTFDVAPAGTTPEDAAKEGVLEALRAEAGKAGRPLKISATFQNVGDAAVQAARVTVEVFRGGERVAVARSDPAVVPAGASRELAVFWTPAKAGAYTLQGWVDYDGLRAGPLGAAMRVAQAGEAGDADAEGDFRVPGPAAPFVVALLAAAALAWRRR